MRAGRVVLLVLGSLIALIGLAIAAGGGTLLWLHQTQRDATGYFTTSTQRFASSGYALTSDKIDLGTEWGGAGWASDVGDLVDTRIRARAPSGGGVFVGIGPETAVRRYLAGVALDRVTDIHYHPFTARYAPQVGIRAPGRPGDQGFWVASSQGPGLQVVRWQPRSGRWTVVVMNADASRGVLADISLGLKVDLLGRIGVGILVGGLLILTIGVLMIVFGARGRDRAPPGAPAAAGAPGAPLAPGGARGSAVRLEGVRDPDLSRGLWLVKWLLAIPHYIVLFFLGLAAIVVSVIAWFAILFTGRYPRGMFEFVVGVMRWSWRVVFYMGVLGTDRYPPFTLARTDHPATLEIDRPERLSRGLIFVKWLLAIPHLLIVGALGASFSGGSGLAALLALVAGVALLFTRRYPPGIFDLLMGIERWGVRVWAYAFLLRDEYPPFRLDQGESEPPEGAPAPR